MNAWALYNDLLVNYWLGYSGERGRRLILLSANREIEKLIEAHVNIGIRRLALMSVLVAVSYRCGARCVPGVWDLWQIDKLHSS